MTKAKREVWAIGDIKKVNKYCKKCKDMLIGIIEVENVPCITCCSKKCEHTLKELKYGRLDNGAIINLRILK